MTNRQITRWLMSIEGDLRVCDANFYSLPRKRIEEALDGCKSKLANIYVLMELQNEPVEPHYNHLLEIETHIKNLEIKIEVERPRFKQRLKESILGLLHKIASIFGLGRLFPAIEARKNLQLTHRRDLHE